MHQNMDYSFFFPLVSVTEKWVEIYFQKMNQIFSIH